MLKRKAYDKLLQWKASHGRKCLMIYGARQVGKTFLVREFGKNEYESFIEINFIQDPELKNIFSGDLQAETIYKRMSANLSNIELIPGKTLIFLDEIQNCGRARTAVKFLAEDGRFDVISSGSLLGLSYAENGDPEAEEPDSIPVGYEDFITLAPLDFEEYLWAMGYSQSAVDLLSEYFYSEDPIPADILDRYEELFREFMVVGGMPEAVADFAENRDFNRVNDIQQGIISNYQNDISKHARGAEKAKVRSCYDAVPKQLAKELRKFQYSTVEKGQTSKKYGNSVRWLIDSALVLPCYNISEPYIPLMANAKDEQFKLYINDTGLLCALYGFETKKALLNNTLKGNAKGGIYENAIAGELVKNGFSLYYYKPDDNHELEFLIEQGGEVVPIEVKAGNTSTVSLNRFVEAFGPSTAYKLVGGGKGRVGAKRTLPHFMVMFIR